MRFWITRNSELSIREQMVRQVLLGILSEDLPSGYKLPSVRTVARQHHIHANTVSAAYHDLLEQGWLELRHGSGLFVRPNDHTGEGQGGLDHLLTGLLQEARRQGYEPEDVRRRLEHLLQPLIYERILIAEQHTAMREILQAEIHEHVGVPVEFVEERDLSKLTKLGRSLVVALPTRAAKVRRSLPPGVLCLPLRLRSVRGALEGQPRPGADSIVSIVSRSAEIRQWSRAMLIAVGLDPECLCEVDAASQGWQDRLSLSALVITDVVAAGELPAGCQAKVFRVIADSSISELNQFCGL
jgi:DNA-binding transcriptional regulator YhcF (GntR family)